MIRSRCATSTATTRSTSSRPASTRAGSRSSSPTRDLLASARMERGRAIVLFAGGGTGGHIYPNIAILERHRERTGDEAAAHFLLSDRLGDAQTAAKLGLAFTASPVRPVPGRPWPHLV